jgi:hypothetical protein
LDDVSVGRVADSLFTGNRAEIQVLEISLGIKRISLEGANEGKRLTANRIKTNDGDGISCGRSQWSKIEVAATGSAGPSGGSNNGSSIRRCGCDLEATEDSGGISPRQA